MTKPELEKMLLEMIHSSEMIINRRNFRTLYFVSNIKKIRLMKLQKIFDTNQNYETKKFSECNYFLKIELHTKNIMHFTMNIEIQKLLNNCFKNNSTKIRYFINDFFKKNFNLDLKNRIVFIHVEILNKSITENSFDKSFDYKNSTENRICVFDFQKYKFDLLNYSYKQIVNIFKKI